MTNDVALSFGQNVMSVLWMTTVIFTFVVLPIASVVLFIDLQKKGEGLVVRLLFVIWMTVMFCSMTIPACHKISDHYEHHERCKQCDLQEK